MAKFIGDDGVRTGPRCETQDDAYNEFERVHGVSPFRVLEILAEYPGGMDTQVVFEDYEDDGGP